MEKIAANLACSTPTSIAVKTLNKFSFPMNCEDKLRIRTQIALGIKTTTTTTTTTTIKTTWHILVTIEAKT